MAALKHPLTGVMLNAIEFERPALGEKEAVTAWILRLQGEKYSNVAHLLGTNTHRLGEVYRGEAFPRAEVQARELLGAPFLPFGQR